MNATTLQFENDPELTVWLETARAVLLSQPEDVVVLEAYATARDLAGFYGRYNGGEWFGPVRTAEETAELLYEANA